MKNILYINGSPRGKKGNSFFILKELKNWLENEGELSSIHLMETCLNIPRAIIGNTGEVIKKMNDASIWIISFPLYIDGLPGHLTWWLEQFQQYRRERGKSKRIMVYALSNCGFPEAIQNRDALRILEMFCHKNGLEWRLGVGIGMGEAYKQMGSMPLKSKRKAKIRHAFNTIKADLINPKSPRDENLYVSVKFPRFLYRLMGTIGWKGQAGKNGLKGKDLYARPWAR